MILQPRCLGLAFLALVFTLPLAAESRTSVKIGSYAGLTSREGGGVNFSGSGTGRLTVKSGDNRDVKGEFALDTIAAARGVGGGLAISLYRAFIQVDFPAIRITTGKARLSWGDGVYFNAGDRLYGSTSLKGNLSDKVFRDEARWLLGTYIPFGLFSFVEMAALPPDLILPGFGADPAADHYEWGNTDAGLRIVTEAADTKFEAGYLYDGDGGEHEPYLSLQGFFLLDWHLAAATAIDPAEAEESFRENLEITAGLFHSHYLQGGGSLGFRLEGLIRPWKEGKPIEEASMADPPYTLFLYPEVSLSGGSTTLVLNGLYSPVDASGLISLLARWKVFQGLTLLGAVSLQAGESSDLFRWDSPGGWGMTIGAEYVF